MDIDFSAIPVDLLLNLLNIALLYIIVRFLVYKPVHNFMQKRTQRVAEEAKKARALNDEAERLKAEYEQNLAQCADENKKLLEKSNSDARESANHILEQAREDARLLIENAQTQCEEEKSHAIADMREDVVDLSLDIAKKLMQREITDADNRKLAEAFFDERQK